jgi:26S proteasome regulatory subunit N5
MVNEDKGNAAPMDAELLGREMDKMEEKQRGKEIIIDQESVKLEVEGLLEKARQSGTAAGRQAAIEGILLVEKRGRLAEDPVSTKLACCSVLSLLHEAGDLKELQEKLVLMTKRRGQLKEAVKAMVRQCMEYVEDEGEGMNMARSQREEMIRTLQGITEGKIYVEIERARITRQLARMKEEDGEVSEAANILQEVAVETFGSMSKVEKIAYILEQVRLCLEKKDYVRAQILSRKISPKAFVQKAHGKKSETTGEIGIEGTSIEAPAKGTPSLEELKLIYYKLMISFHSHEKNYIEICRSYRAILDTPSIEADKSASEDALKHAAWYSILAPRDSDQITLLHANKSDPRMESMPLYKSLLNHFSKDEVLWWNALTQEFAEEIDSQTDIFGGEDNQCRKDWRLRVIEHNVYTISKFYSKIKLARLAQVLELSEDKAEDTICSMVSERGLVALIDRPAGTIRFGSTMSNNESLNSWSSKIEKVLNLVEKTCQQIQKESQIHKVTLQVGTA